VTRIEPHLTTPENTAAGWINGFIGALIFSASLPATRAAVMDLDPIFQSFAALCIDRRRSCGE
jgi:hypothetical protein